MYQISNMFLFYKFQNPHQMTNINVIAHRDTMEITVRRKRTFAKFFNSHAKEGPLVSQFTQLR